VSFLGCLAEGGVVVAVEGRDVVPLASFPEALSGLLFGEFRQLGEDIVVVSDDAGLHISVPDVVKFSVRLHKKLCWRELRVGFW
jgi:hypothetical protein